MLSAIYICCRYSSVIQTRLLSWSWKQSLWQSLWQYFLSYAYILKKRIKRCNIKGIGSQLLIWFILAKKRNNKKEETWSDWNPCYLNLREHLSYECLGQVWLNAFSIFLLVACTEPTVRMHRLMCIFIINRFQTAFSHEMTVISEIYCQNLKE